MSIRSWLLVPLVCLSTVAGAIEPGPSSEQQKRTEQWLQLQVSGVQASAKPQTASAAERDLALQRWLNSYNYPIPEHFDQKESGSISSK